MMVGLALASLPSGRYSFSVAMMQPCVTLREFSMTSTPNWRMSPEQTCRKTSKYYTVFIVTLASKEFVRLTSRGNDSSDPLLNR